LNNILEAGKRIKKTLLPKSCKKGRKGRRTTQGKVCWRPEKEKKQFRLGKCAGGRGEGGLAPWKLEDFPFKEGEGSAFLVQVFLRNE
jgi:hypothetical protein